MSYTAEDFAKMEVLKKKYPKGINCYWCEHYNVCPYPNTNNPLTQHNCCDFKERVEK